MCDPSPHSFCDQVSLKLRDRPHDVKQQLTRGCRGVDPLGVRNEVNPQGFEFIQTVHQMLNGASETVELPDQDDIESPLAGIIHECVKLGTPTLGATHAFIHEFVAAAKPLFGIAPQVFELHVAALVHRTDPSVKCDRLRARIPHSICAFHCYQPKLSNSELMLTLLCHSNCSCR